MSCRLDAPVSDDELDCQRIYSRKERRLQYLKCKDRIDTDVFFGFMDHPNPEKNPSVPEDLYYGILDAMRLDDEIRADEIYELECWLDDYSGV